MERIRTLTEMMELRAKESATKTAFCFGGTDYTFSQLWQRAGQMAAALRRQGVSHGDRVVLAVPNGPDFFFALYGTLRLGGIAVPMFPGSGPERIAARVRLCAASAVIVTEDDERDRLETLQALLRSGGTAIIRANGVPQDSIADGSFRVEPDDVAMLQYTSGSTGNPKGVQLSHDNLLTNVRQMIDGMEITCHDIFVSWLPVFHDMGLILKTMVPFYLPAKLVLLPTSLTNVRTWLKTIDTHRATFTAAPDFAYRLCLRYIRDPESYDLSSLRVALNAAEPVRPTTIREFESAFGLHNVMAPAYGLAEATVGVTMWPPGTETICDERGLVSVGFPFPGITLKVSRDGTELKPGAIGTILIQSPANSRGYWNNPDATAALLEPGGYIDSGDAGYVDDHGRLFIAGREKNIIITAGRTIAPQEVEEIVDGLPEVRFSAALGIDRGRIEGEQLYVFAEMRRVRSTAAQEEATLAIVNKIHAGLGLRPGRVYLLKPRSIPQTHNGKIQHLHLKDRYLSGALRKEELILFPDY